MKMSSSDDHAQTVLLDQLQELHPDIPRDLLLTCFRIEKEHQFDREMDVVLNQLRRVVNQALDNETGPLSSTARGGRRK